jgi:hypothetical protein
MRTRSRKAAPLPRPARQGGAAAVLFVLTLATLLGAGALAVDVGNLVVARQELRNAADAGALAGARCLYNDGEDYPDEPDCLDTIGDVGDVNVNANQVAANAATANMSRNSPAEVNAPTTNLDDVERGHWSWGLGNLPRGFYPNDSTDPFDLWTYSTLELDQEINFVNAVRVTTRRQGTQVQSFFSRVLGFSGFDSQATAVAWIGFAGTLQPTEADQPIALCKQKLLAGDTLDCNVGRFVPSTGETGGWTTFEQVDAVEQCNVLNTPDSSIRPLVCSTGNPNVLEYGKPMSADNGQKNNSFDDLADCWEGATGRNQGWDLTLPVVDCDTQANSKIQPCSTLVGAVDVTVVWIQKGQPDESRSCDETLQSKIDQAAPCQMDDWTFSGSDSDGDGDVDGNDRWDEFAAHFNLVTENGDPATVANGGWQQKTIYFKPSCTPHEPTGDSGGENFGILAKIPRLVQ